MSIHEQFYGAEVGEMVREVFDGQNHALVRQLYADENLGGKIDECLKSNGTYNLRWNNREVEDCLRWHRDGMGAAQIASRIIEARLQGRY